MPAVFLFVFNFLIKFSEKNSANYENKSNKGAKLNLFFKKNGGNQKRKKRNKIGKVRDFRSIFRAFKRQSPKKISYGVYNDSEPKETEPLGRGNRNPFFGEKSENRGANRCHKPEYHHSNALVIIKPFVEHRK